MNDMSNMSKTRRETLLKQIGKRRDVMRTQVRSVAQGYTTALFVYGPGGLGKTHVVTEELDGLCGKSWCHHTAYSTPRGLFAALAESRDSIHLFEDCEKLYKTDVASSILRAACGGPRGADRWVTYETANENMRVKFTGGIIIVSNESLSRSKGPLAAVASRFRPIKWDLNIEERIATILEIADQGFERGDLKLEPVHCRKVAEFLVDEMTTSLTGANVDLRTYVEHALPAYAMWIADKSGSNWRDIVRSKLSGDVAPDESRGHKTRRLEELAMLISSRTELTTIASKVAAWKNQTGLGQAIYYRHLKAAKARAHTDGKPTSGQGPQS